MMFLFELSMLYSLFSTDCIKQGKFILKSGEISKYYFSKFKLVFSLAIIPETIFPDIGPKVHPK